MFAKLWILSKLCRTDTIFWTEPDQLKAFLL